MNLKHKYIIYSCSGCSSAAQTANEVAIRLSCNKNIKMSCIAGVGGGVNTLIKVAKNKNFKKILLDGCELSCSKSCFDCQKISFDMHVDLSNEQLKIPKKMERFSETDVLKTLDYLHEMIMINENGGL